MYEKCPKCGHAVPEAERAAAETCAACGLVFRKYRQALAGSPARVAPVPPEVDEAEEEREGLFARFVYVPDQVQSWRVYVGAALLAASVYLGLRFFFMNIPEWEMAGTFFHNAMVPFHEFGHILFRPFGEFMMFAGGSLVQWLMPLAFLALFSLKNRDNLAASLMLWWCGTQWIDLAPYAWDAKMPQHVLLTGQTGDTGPHDYIEILGDLHLLRRAHEVAWVMHKLGLVLMLLAWIWGVYILWRQFQRRADFVVDP
jgi:hypothetical protein